MSEGKGKRLSLAQRSEIWRRWKSGQSLHEIGRAFGKPHSSIRCLLLPRGGIAPAARRRSRLALKLPEREDISRRIASGSSIREIARHLDRAALTVSREVTPTVAVLPEDGPAYLPGAFELALGSLAAVPRIAEPCRTGAGMVGMNMTMASFTDAKNSSVQLMISLAPGFLLSGM